MKIQCGHCKAGPSSLNAFVRYLSFGLRLQVVKCVICGWEVSRPEPATPRIDQPMPVKKKPIKPAVVRPPKPKFQRCTCTHVNCNGTYAIVARTKFNLCPDCAVRQYGWIKRGMRTPPPFIRQGDVWIDNPERKQRRGAKR